MSLFVQAISQDGEQTDWLCDRLSYEGTGDVNLIRDGETAFTLGPEDYAGGFNVAVFGAVGTEVLN